MKNVKQIFLYTTSVYVNDVLWSKKIKAKTNMVGQYSQNISWSSHSESSFVANFEKSIIFKTHID